MTEGGVGEEGGREDGFNYLMQNQHRSAAPPLCRWHSYAKSVPLNDELTSLYLSVLLPSILVALTLATT